MPHKRFSSSWSRSPCTQRFINQATNGIITRFRTSRTARDNLLRFIQSLWLSPLQIRWNFGRPEVPQESPLTKLSLSFNPLPPNSNLRRQLMPWLEPSTTSINPEENKIDDEPLQGEEAQVPPDSSNSQDHPQSYTWQSRPNLFEFSLVSWDCRSLNQTKSSYLQTLGANIYCLQESHKPKPQIQLAWQPCDVTTHDNKGGGYVLTAYPQDFVPSREHRTKQGFKSLQIHSAQSKSTMDRQHLSQQRKNNWNTENLQGRTREYFPEEWQAFIGIGDWNVDLA